MHIANVLFLAALVALADGSGWSYDRCDATNGPAGWGTGGNACTCVLHPLSSTPINQSQFVVH